MKKLEVFLNFIVTGGLLISVILFTQLALLNFIFNQSKNLAMFGNLPHRYLGGLYWCTMLQPEREDYAFEYFAQWHRADREQFFLEGQTRPVVPMWGVQRARDLYFDPDMQRVRFAFMLNHVNGKSGFQYGQGQEPQP